MYTSNSDMIANAEYCIGNLDVIPNPSFFTEKRWASRVYFCKPKYFHKQLTNGVTFLIAASLLLYRHFRWTTPNFWSN